MIKAIEATGWEMYPTIMTQWCVKRIETLIKWEMGAKIDQTGNLRPLHQMIVREKGTFNNSTTWAYLDNLSSLGNADVFKTYVHPSLRGRAILLNTHHLYPN